MRMRLPIPSVLWAGLLEVIALGTVGLSPASVQAELRFPQPVADLGEIRTGPPLTQRFRFINQGAAPVEITEVRASCGCLTPHLAQQSYRPGEEGVLELTINTLSQAPGPHTWNVRLHYRSEDVVYEMTVQLRARLISEVLVQPAALVVFVDKAAGHEITLTDLRPRPLVIATVQASSPKLKPHLTKPARDPDGHWIRTIRLEVADDYPEGRHDEVVAIYTEDPDYREFKVPVTILKRVPQRLSTVPAQVTLSAPAGQPITSRIVLVRDSANEGVTVDKVIAEDPAIVCQWAPGPNTMATVKITVDRTRVHGGSLHSAVQVHVRKPVAETLTIPVTYYPGKKDPHDTNPKRQQGPR